MSLTQDIANLTGQVTDLTARVSDWIDQADTKITEAVRSIPKMRKRIYVHATEGNDEATGSESDPVRTVAEAIQRVPASGWIDVWLLSDVIIDTSIEADSRSVVSIVSQTGSAPARITFGTGWTERWDGYRLCSIRAPRYMFLGGVEIVYPATQPQPPSDHGVVDTGLIQMRRGGFLGMWNVTINGSAPSTPLERTVIGAPGFTDIMFTGATSWPAELAGVIIDGVPAGGDPNARWNLRSNITSL